MDPAVGIGDTVFYPAHGGAVIEGLETRRIKGEDTTYAVLRVAGNNGLVLRVPARDLEQVGARPALDRAEVAQLFDLLGTGANEGAVPWAQRCREYADALASRDVFRTARAVRDLERRARQQGLSASQRRLLAKGRRTLIAQLAFSLQTTHERAERDLDTALRPDHPTS
jgi:CarD family transcriptional regulator